MRKIIKAIRETFNPTPTAGTLNLAYSVINFTNKRDQPSLPAPVARPAIANAIGNEGSE
jgi:hypothetical protein